MKILYVFQLNKACYFIIKYLQVFLYLICFQFKTELSQQAREAQWEWACWVQGDRSCWWSTPTAPQSSLTFPSSLKSSRNNVRWWWEAGRTWRTTPSRRGPSSERCWWRASTRSCGCCAWGASGIRSAVSKFSPEKPRKFEFSIE